MKELYRVICGKCRNSEKPGKSYFFGKTLVVSIIWSKWQNEDEKLF